MKTFRQIGDTVTVTAPANVVSGQGVLVGDIFGAALSDALSGQPVEIAVEGVVGLPKAAGAINEGVRLFWDNAAGRITTTATSNRVVGWMATRGGSSAADGTIIDVKLGRPNAVAA